MTITPPQYFNKLFITAIILAVLDAATTTWALVAGWGYEANPAAGMLTHNLPMMIGVGVICTLTIAAATLLPYKTVRLFAITLIVIKAIVVANNFYQMSL